MPFSSPLDLELQVDTFSRLGLNFDLKVYTTYGFPKTCLLEKKLYENPDTTITMTNLFILLEGCG